MSAEYVMDEELEAFLREEGIDPEWVKAEWVRMAQSKRTPEEEAKLAAEREELRESTEAHNRLIAERGSLADHVRAYEQSRARNRS
ncbi:MAG: hypothetical protein NVV62_17945 [Terricaulis sp.]|nr:hypothetical protein [Terricaulis sp.]